MSFYYFRGYSGGRSGAGVAGGMPRAAGLSLVVADNPIRICGPFNSEVELLRTSQTSYYCHRVPRITEREVTRPVIESPTDGVSTNCGGLYGEHILIVQGISL